MKLHLKLQISLWIVRECGAKECVCADAGKVHVTTDHRNILSGHTIGAHPQTDHTAFELNNQMYVYLSKQFMPIYNSKRSLKAIKLSIPILQQL